MFKDEIKILKIGGAAITDKNKPFSVLKDTLESISKQISRFIKESNTKLIIVHGGGSYGHPVAYKHLSSGGLTVKSFIEISKVMRDLNNLVIMKLREYGINAYSFPPSSSFLLDNGVVIKYWLEPIARALSLNVTPVLYGDIVIDVSKGFNIISGDTITAILMRELNCKRGYFATSVDGVYDEKGEVIDYIEVSKSKSSQKLLKTGTGIDVTGGMARKLVELALYCPIGYEAIIFNGRVGDNVYNVLKHGSLKRCTIVRIVE